MKLLLLHPFSHMLEVLQGLGNLLLNLAILTLPSPALTEISITDLTPSLHCNVIIEVLPN